ncbi:hypothetical protein AMTR_s00035p00171800 [Amborella trichopoda]|uniref:Uncharacterized protein n=1 Tax=Amborella trichopoda TaxID=13333 RepID=W1PPU9_AMBTC|nr:hypothetical protein AMTR_s00035p00171800 [Amborella trichopoda]
MTLRLLLRAQKSDPTFICVWLERLVFFSLVIAGLWSPIMAVWVIRLRATGSGGIQQMLTTGMHPIHGKLPVAQDVMEGLADASSLLLFLSSAAGIIILLISGYRPRTIC